ncbi:hypothetical protein [Cylindrospermum sp. FACHB-282]|uniref:hypothetical protein n=1 Tax=Cylindrospermum sp. FACHB-282 TaxID=2692794 RepID=UPI0016878350|nr:hypothetical protein [Cylindrospermum sp. FACHB-282]MBD2386644.1 hypothetical protein [Cylindrospermum sp. FACHB-282]
MFNRLLFAGILVIIIWSGILSNTASPQQVDSRINNLEFDLRRLDLRLNQIELQLSKIGQSPSSRITLTPPSSNGSRRSLAQSERDKMLERLSTLVVELKQQVNNLDKRVSKIESR